MRRSPGSLLLMIVILASACVAPLLAMAQQVPDERCFVETGHCVAGRFRDAWEQNGGDAVLGFPLGPAADEVVGGRRVRAQWFERARLELDPDGSLPNDIVLGNLGVERLAMAGRDWRTLPLGQPRSECLFFATNHTLCEPFLAFWRAHGLELDGVAGISDSESQALFGAPISEPEQITVDGVDVTIQWFERARFELRGDGQSTNVVAAPLGSELFPKMPATFVTPAPSPTPPGSRPSPKPPGPNGSGGSGGGPRPPPVPNVIVQDRAGAAPVPMKGAVKVVNKTGNVIRFTLDGPTGGAWTLADGQEFQPDVEVGAYQVTMSTTCGPTTQSFTIGSGALKEILLSCEGSRQAVGLLKVANNTGGQVKLGVTGPVAYDWLLVDGQSMEQQLLPGDYQSMVTSRCGSAADSFTLQANEIKNLVYSCEGTDGMSPQPTPPSTARLQIVNQTGAVARFSLEGASPGSWSIGDGASQDVTVTPGQHQISVVAACGSGGESLSLAAGETQMYTAQCSGLTPPTPPTPAPPQGTGTLHITNNTGGTITVTVSGASEGTWSIGHGEAFNQPLPVGEYQMSVRARCGNASESFRVVRNATRQFSYSCVG